MYIYTQQIFLQQTAQEIGSFLVICQLQIQQQGTSHGGRSLFYAESNKSNWTTEVDNRVIYNIIPLNLVKWGEVKPTSSSCRITSHPAR